MKKSVRKEFIAQNEARAILDAKIEFGDDFDIIKKESTEIGGILGFFTKPGIKLVIQSPKTENVRKRLREKNRKEEVKKTALNTMHDLSDNSQSKERESKELQNMKDFISDMTKKKNSTKYNQNDEDTELLKKLFSNPTINPIAREKNNYVNFNNAIIPNKKKNTTSNKAIDNLSDEILKIKKTLENIKIDEKERNEKESNEGCFYKKYFNLLQNEDFPCLLLHKIMEKHEKYLNRVEMENEELYVKKLKEFLIDHIYTRSGISTDGKKKISLIGPTGIGKTTTIAKLGYFFKYENKKSVKIITIDCFKYGGIKQLEDICCEMEIDFVPVYDKESYIKEINDDNYDIILIDTSGKNFRDLSNVLEIKEYIDKDVDIEKYLVLSAESKYKDLMQINDNFSDVCIKGVIFTKCDMCEYYGTMLGFLIKSKNSFVYMTFGKKIDGDIQEAVPYKIVDGLFDD
ncbi:MAG: hypothetical protein M0R46_09620 [Candidatus Muirbacterium halophilum]|nr:hypothetical protein [Candidatus Muirbacterium halophilum]MCK9476167.1 hypothetical protein [Candidatus Muirbacterium halophilum]